MASVHTWVIFFLLEVLDIHKVARQIWPAKAGTKWHKTIFLLTLQKSSMAMKYIYQFSIGDTSSNGPFSIAMLVKRRVNHAMANNQILVPEILKQLVV